MTDYSKLDHWSLKAQKEGYPARSVYKLKEMDEKFGLIKPGRTPFKVLDLGAAPGSWSLYVLRKFFGRTDISGTDKNISGTWSNISGTDKNTSGTDKASGNKKQVLLVSVDLSPLSRDFDRGLFGREGFTFIQGDFTQSEIREAILSQGPYSLLLSDAAPATTGNRSVDTMRSLELAETAVDYASSALVRGGNLVVKVFQGGDTGSLLKTMRGLFETAKSFKPEACRSGSFEVYYLGLGKKTP